MAKFKTRARTVDMLGRQQIAGIPTAISELFKNAHDAYADNAQVDYFRSDGLFVLRDDGVGMTKEDFESRWLTLGTESKLEGYANFEPPYIPPEKSKRPTMGEKGIGRLAIGVIGRQVLVLTRAIRDSGLQELVAAFIHWGLFELPGIDIEDIEIPVQTFAGGSLPNIDDVNNLVNVVRKNLNDLSSRIDNGVAIAIQKELTDFIVDPEDLESFAEGPKLGGNGHGTHFYILPADETLSLDIDSERKNTDNLAFTKFLLGFTNTMTPGKNLPPLKTEFRDWKSDTEDDFEELIGPGNFITPEEFEVADHHIQGCFDEYGQFSGTIGIYNEEPVSHVVPWNKAAGKKTLCGPFGFNMAYIQGTQGESKLSSEDYSLISQKLNRIGGLYIYRDNIRILPYGNSDVDFLGIELRRTKSAAYYYFSHRNMAGAIDISQSKNKKLVEKAGREGFQENKAYRQFREILINFFLQLTADFFREKGKKSSEFIEQREELKKTAAAKKKSESQSKTKRKNFTIALDTGFSKIESREPQQKTDEIINEVKKAVEAATRQDTPDKAASILIRAENNANKKIETLRMEYKVTKPRGVGLTKQLNKDWEAYLTEYDRIENDTFAQASRQIFEIIGSSAKQARLYVDQRKRLEVLLKQVSDDSIETVKSKAGETRSVLDTTHNNVLNLLKTSIAEMQDLINQTTIDFQRTDLDKMDNESIENFRISIEKKLHEATSKHEEVLESVRHQLKEIQIERDENGHLISQSDMMAAQEDQILALQERADADLELSQLGMAIDIINHEFNNSIKAIRSNIRKLKSWAEQNESINPLYQNIRNSFEHLDGYLTLFTPLHRRLTRKNIYIKGSNIANFIKDLFKERLKRHQISMRDTSEFRKKTIKGYPSTFYPVFVNLIDNAIFWLKDQNGPRIIELDVENDSFVVIDNGPGIPVRDRDMVFEMGFSRKPGGRGLGLFISKDVLKKVGYELKIGDNKNQKGVRFYIIQSNED